MSVLQGDRQTAEKGREALGYLPKVSKTLSGENNAVLACRFHLYALRIRSCRRADRFDYDVKIKTATHGSDVILNTDKKSIANKFRDRFFIFYCIFIKKAV